MSYSDYPNSSDTVEPVVPVAPENGAQTIEAAGDENDGVIVGDGFGLHSPHGVFVYSRLRVFETEYPLLGKIRRHCEQMDLNLKPLLSTLGLENTVQNFCRQLSNFIQLALSHFEDKPSRTFLLSGNKNLSAETKKFADEAKLKGRAIVDLLTLLDQVRSLENQIDADYPVIAKPFKGLKKI